MEILEAVEKDGEPFGWLAWCPGCDMYHHFDTRWTFDGNKEKPTFSPSMLSTRSYGPEHVLQRCHSFVRNGVWEFLNDCTHELKGQHVPMTVIPRDDDD